MSWVGFLVARFQHVCVCYQRTNLIIVDSYLDVKDCTHHQTVEVQQQLTWRQILRLLGFKECRGLCVCQRQNQHERLLNLKKTLHAVLNNKQADCVTCTLMTSVSSDTGSIREMQHRLHEGRNNNTAVQKHSATGRSPAPGSSE